MVETNINKRWEQGMPHHPSSEAVAKIIRKADSDGMWSFGGDGDNGEELMYYLDIYFEQEDEKKTRTITWHPKAPPAYMQGDCIPQCITCFGGISEITWIDDCHICKCENPHWSMCHGDIQAAKKAAKQKTQNA